MLYDVLRFLPWLWQAILQPYVFGALATLVSDGAEAVSHLSETVYVLFCFFCGRSHRRYPLRTKELNARKAMLLQVAREKRAATAAATAAMGGNPNTSGIASFDTEGVSGIDSEDEDTVRSSSDGGSSVQKLSDASRGTKTPSGAATAAAAAAAARGSASGSSVFTNLCAARPSTPTSEKKPSSSNLLLSPATSLNSSTASAGSAHHHHDGNSGGDPVLIGRRILLGKKGEIEDWQPAVLGRLLVPLSYPLSYSHSLHRLVATVIGPIQQPSVSTMPNRHPAPQWPPHYVRSGGGGAGGVGSGGAATSGLGGATGTAMGGGGAGAGGGERGAGLGMGGFSRMEEYSSSASSSTTATTGGGGAAGSAILRRRGGGGGGMGDSVFGDSGSSAGEGGAAGAGGGGAAVRSRVVGGQQWRPASSVVYRRVSSRQLDVSSRSRRAPVAAHLIASITAHHVLSYQATRQKVLVMDLDETLCHVSTTTANMAGPPTFSEVIPTSTGAELYHVWVRPYADLFLATAAKLFNLVLFTSASKPYAETILRRIDPERRLKERYYRQDCRVISRGMLAKVIGSSNGGSAVGGTREGSIATSATTRLPPLSHGATGGPARQSTISGSAAEAAKPTESALSSGSTSLRRESESEEPQPTAPLPQPLLSSTTSSLSTSSSAAGHDEPCGSSASAAAAFLTTPPSPPTPLIPTADLPAKPAFKENTKVLVKDLRVLKVPPELLIMIDNAEECTLLSRENALVIAPYIPLAPSEKSVLRHSAGSGEGGLAAVAPSTVSNVDDTDADVGGNAEGAGADGKPHAHSPVTEGRSGGANVNGPVVSEAPGDDALGRREDEDPENDDVLLGLLPLLEALLVVPDVRSILRYGKA